MTEIILNILKFLALGISGVFGVVGVMGETRTARGQFTRWGKLTLWGIVISTLVGGVIQTVELIKDKQEAKEKEREARRTIEEIRAPLMPSGRMALSYEITLQLSHPSLAAYKKRIHELIAPVMGKELTTPEPANSHWWPLTDDNGTRIDGVEFGSGSPYFPQAADGEQLATVFNHFGVEASVGPKEKETKDAARFHAFPKDGTARYYFSPKEDTIRVDVADAELRGGDSWHTDGTIVALPDLAAKTIEVGFIGFDWGADAAVSLGIELEKVATIEYFKFFAANRSFSIGNMRHEAGKPLIYEFPANLMDWGINLPRTEEERRAGPRK
jgi:hypothetical protein